MHFSQLPLRRGFDQELQVEKEQLGSRVVEGIAVMADHQDEDSSYHSDGDDRDGGSDASFNGSSSAKWRRVTQSSGFYGSADELQRIPRRRRMSAQKLVWEERAPQPATPTSLKSNGSSNQSQKSPHVSLSESPEVPAASVAKNDTNTTKRAPTTEDPNDFKRKRKKASSGDNKSRQHKSKKSRSPKKIAKKRGSSSRKKHSSPSLRTRQRHAKEESLSISAAFERFRSQTISCRCSLCGRVRRIPPHDRTDPSSDPRTTSPVWACSNFLNLPCCIPNETWNDVVDHFCFSGDPTPAKEDIKMVAEKVASSEALTATTTISNRNKNNQNNEDRDDFPAWRVSDIPLGLTIYCAKTGALEREETDLEQIYKIYSQVMLMLEESKPKRTTPKRTAKEMTEAAPSSSAPSESVKGTERATAASPAAAPAAKRNRANPKVTQKRRASAPAAKAAAATSAAPDSSSSARRESLIQEYLPAGRRRSRRGMTDDSEILSLPYKYNGMDWDPIAKCWVPKPKIKLPPKKTATPSTN